MKDGVLSLSHVNAPVSALPIRTTLAASTISESLIEKIRQFQRKAPSSNRVAHFFVPQATYPLFNLHYAESVLKILKFRTPYARFSYLCSYNNKTNKIVL